MRILFEHYVMAALWWLGLTMFLVSVVVLVRNAGSLTWFLATSGSARDTAQYFGQLLVGLPEQFSFFGAGLIVLTAALLSFNIVLLSLVFLQRRRTFRRARSTPVATSMLGTVLALFGVGCAACGSAVLVSLFSVVGVSGVLVWLPYHGTEIGVLGLLLLTASAWRLLRTLGQSATCAV